ncbi:hypothetical protein LDENG_00180160 [Lucifuga dentata]|nr:hypothetical protein LDENG_00180160 [Lucifuga dentata]
MSAQSTKKRRIGSRRRLDQSEISEAGDGFHITDSPSAAQHTLEENTESLVGMANTSQSECHYPSSAVVTGNRRKFVSSWRKKQRQAEDSGKELYQEPIEEDVETQTDDIKPEVECNDNRSPENMTAMTVQNESFREESELIDDWCIKQRQLVLDEQAILDEPAAKMPSATKTKQEELSQESENNIMFVRRDSSMHSATIPDYAVELQSPEPLLESSFTKTKNLEGDHHDRESDCKLKAVVCESFDSILEGTDKSHTLHSEDGSDQLKAKAHLVDMSQLSAFTSHSISPMNLWLNDQSNSKEMPDDELTPVYPVMDQEDKKIDEDTELLRQSGKLQANNLLSESHIKAESIKALTTTEKSHPGESTEHETIVQTRFPSPTVEIPTNVNQNEHEVEVAQQSEVNEQEAKETQRQEMHQIHSPEYVLGDVTESFDVSFRNLIDEVRICDTQQPESTLETVDKSVNKQEVSNPDDKEDSANQSNFEDLGQRNVDDYYGSTDNIEHVGTAVGLVYEGEGQVQKDTDSTAEQTFHRENERLRSGDDNKSSLQTLQLGINAPLYSKPQDNSVSTEDQTNTNSKTVGKITKMKSSGKYLGCEENTEKVQDEGTVLSQNNNDNSPAVTITEITAHSDKDDFLKSSEESNEKENVMKMTEVPENGSQLTEYKEFEKIESQQSPEISFCKDSDIQNISFHNDNVNLRSSPVDMLDQGEIFQVQNMDAMSIDKETLREEIHMTESDNVIDTVAHDTIKDLTEITEDFDTKAEGLMNVQHSAKDEVTEQCGNPTKTDHVAQETNALHETYSETFLTTQNEMILSDTLAAFNIHHEEKFKKESPELPVNVSENSAISNTDGVCESQEGLLDKIQNEESNENVQLTSKQKRRKMGSTRKIHWKQEEERDKDKKEGDLNTEAEERNRRSPDPQLQIKVEHKCSTSDLYAVLEERSADNETTDMTQTCVSTQLNNPKENNHQTENKETVRVNTCENISNEEVGACFLTTCKSAMPDNEEIIDNDSKSGRTIDSALSLLDRKEKKVPERALNEKTDIVEELSVSITAEALQYGNSKTSTGSMGKEREQGVNESMNKQKEGRDTSELLNTESRRISGWEDSTELSGNSGSLAASHNEEVGNALVFVQPEVVRDDEGNVDNVDVSVASSQLGEITATEMYTASELTESNSCSVSELLPPNTGDDTNTEPDITGRRSVDFCETTKSKDKALKPEEAHEVAVIKLEIVKSEVKGGCEENNVLTNMQEPNNISEGAHSTNIEIRNASPAIRRRKMGSTRKNLRGRIQRGRSRFKEEGLHRNQENNEVDVKDVGDEMSESVSNVKEKKLPLQSEHKDDEQEKGNMKEHGHVDSKSRSLQSMEENPVTHVPMVETEHHLSPPYLPPKPAASPEHHVLSESTFESKRRKMGSHRKLRGHQNNEDLNVCEDKVTATSDGRDPEGKPENANKSSEEHKQESESLDKQSVVEQRSNKPSFSVNISTTGERSTPAGLLDKQKPVHVTRAQHPDPKVHHQKTEKRYSFSGNSKRSDLNPNCYNLIIIGNSSVGKSSFMKRVQSGTFSSDVCASLGIDTCIQTVIVDGNPVVLQLWDTAGQERFHSITRQIFHKAQAFLLMYDITSSESFSAVRYWVDCIQEGAAESVIIMLLGNKCDCAERQVQSHEGEILAKEYNFAFMECSAATGENLTCCLETVARMLSQKADTKEGMVLHKEPQQRKTLGCC